MSLKWKFYYLSCIVTIVCSIFFIAKTIYFDIVGNSWGKSVSIFIYGYTTLLILKSFTGIRFLYNVKTGLYRLPKKIIRASFYIVALLQLLFAVMCTYILIDSIAKNGFLYQDIWSLIFYLSNGLFSIFSFYVLVFDIPLMRKLKKNVNLEIETIGTENINLQ